LTDLTSVLLIDAAARAAMEVEMSLRKKLAVGLAVVSGVYLFVPEPTDVLPIIGWLDEGAALALLGWSMKTLGVTPSAILARIKGQKALPASDIDAAQAARNVTPA
jgi:hypothetical protein